MSAGLLFSYHEKVEQMFETTSNPYSGASNSKFLQKIVCERKQKTLLPSLLLSSSSLSSSLLSLSSISSSSSQFIGSPWCQPCLRSFGIKKTNYNHCRHHQNHHHNHHYHNNHHCHIFSSPLWCRLCLRSLGSKISHFPSSRLVKFQHKIGFQPRRLSSFLKKKNRK